MPRRAFIVGPYLAYGGTFMVYHLARILRHCFGLETIAVSQVGETAEVARQAGIFRYDYDMPSVPIAQLEEFATSADILVSCDMGSRYLLGYRFPGKKIAYAQTLQPSETIDMRFDHYVSVSDIVSRYYAAVYGLVTEVIPPFINLEHLPETPDWMERPHNVVLPYRKGSRSGTQVWDTSMQLLRQYVAHREPSITFAEPLFNGVVQSQDQVLQAIGQARFLLMLTEMEGFGLVPLEAMAMGTIPVGFDGFGGQHYLRPGVNCGTVPYARLEAAGDTIIQLVKDEQGSALISARARQTGRLYDYGSFAAAWSNVFARILGTPASARLDTPYRSH